MVIDECIKRTLSFMLCVIRYFRLNVAELDTTFVRCNICQAEHFLLHKNCVFNEMCL